MEKEGFKLENVSVRLVQESPIYSEVPILMPDDAIRAVGSEMASFDREVLAVINLDIHGRPINVSYLSVGTLDNSLAHPRDMLKVSILSNANRVILLHCHPSGILIPSSDDIKLTDRMNKVYAMVGILLVDHIIFGGRNLEEYFSFCSKGLLKFPDVKYATDCSQIELPGLMVAEGRQSLPTSRK